MIYRIHLTAGDDGSGVPRGLPVSETRKRADAAADLAETLCWNSIRANNGYEDAAPYELTAEATRALADVRAIDVERGGHATFYGRTLFITPSRS